MRRVEITSATSALLVSLTVLLLLAHFVLRYATASMHYRPLTPWISGTVSITLLASLIFLFKQKSYYSKSASIATLILAATFSIIVAWLFTDFGGVISSLHAVRLMLTSSEIFGLVPVLLSCTIAYKQLVDAYFHENRTPPTIWTVLLSAPPLLPLFILISPGTDRDLAGLMLAFTTILGCLALLFQIYRKPPTTAFIQAVIIAGLACIYYFPIYRGIATSGEASAFLLVWTVAFLLYRHRIRCYSFFTDGYLYRPAGLTVLGLIAGVLLHHSLGLIWLIDHGYLPIYVPVLGSMIFIAWLVVSYPSLDFRSNVTAVQLFSLATPLIIAPLLSVVSISNPVVNESSAWGPAQRAAKPTEAVPLNQWIELQTDGFTPRRRAHSGAVFDQHRGEILMTGSDTHGWDWDMSLYRFNVANRKWHRYGKAEPRYTYRNLNGVRVAGTITPTPWAMHVYDQLVLDSSKDRLWIISAPLHNHVPLTGSIQDVPWSFDLSKSGWTPQKFEDSVPPVFFSAVSVLDPARNTIMATAASQEGLFSIGIGQEFDLKRGGLWELGPDRLKWLPVSDTSPHGHNVSGVFDDSLGALLIFERQLDFRVHAFLPGVQPGMAGQWSTVSIPDGPCVPMSAYPAVPSVYITHLRKTLLITTGLDGKNRTCIYDAHTNSMTDLDIEIPPKLDMNFTIAEDTENKSVMLVTGNSYDNSPAQVWVLKLQFPLD